ncbi:hypothetical protein Hanom_Chr13g01217831 [Helianthus anomalus]
MCLYNRIKSSEITPSSLRRRRTYIISDVTSAIALYSDSALDLDTVCCFLLFQDTRFPPTKTQYPVVDRREIGQPAQSVSENADIRPSPSSVKAPTRQ